MNYTFWADPDDTVSVFQFVFADELRVYDLGSAWGGHVREYKNVDDIKKSFDLYAERKSQFTFLLWNPRHGGRPTFRRFPINPNYCDGHTFRYGTEGLGLIQLYFGGIRQDTLARSTLGHLSENRARLFEADRPYELDRASNWNWKEIQRTSRRLKYQIHNKLAVENFGGAGILPEAKSLFDQGVQRVL